MCRRICIEGMVKWLVFSISSPLIWAPSLVPKPVNWHMTASGYATDLLQMKMNIILVSAGTQKR